MARLGVIKTSAALGGDRDMGQGMEGGGRASDHPDMETKHDTKHSEIWDKYYYVT